MTDVYFNLRKHVFSVRERGRVIGHERSLCVRDARFVVRSAGRQRVLDTGHKNVHAFVRGTVEDDYPYSPDSLARMYRIRYNPYEAGYFTLDGAPIYEAEYVVLRLMCGAPKILLPPY